MNIFDNKQKLSQSFDKTYQDYITPIYKYVYIRIRHKQEAEDLTHTVFLKAFENSKSKNIDITLNYLFTIARTTVIDFWRKKKSVNPSDPDKIFNNIEDNNSDIHAEVVTKDQDRKIKKVIEYLDGDQKDVIIMRFINDMTTKEISQIMQKTEVAVRKIQSRAINVLRELKL